MANLQDKFAISLGSALLFVLVNLPGTYKLVDSLLPVNVFNGLTNCPTFAGLLVHTLVFFLVTYFTMTGLRASRLTKLSHSLTGTLLFFFFSSPTAYALTGSLFGETVANGLGCPTNFGILLHGTLYCLALVAFMYLP